LKRSYAIAGGVLLLALIIIGSVVGSGSKGERVYAEPVTRRDIAAIVSAPGEVDPKVKVNISSHVIAKIEKLHFKEGDTVREGQLLVDLERVGYVAQRDQVRSQLDSRRIETRRARINLANAELQLRRAASLRSQGIAAQDLYDKAKLDDDNARAAVDAADEAVRQAQAALSQVTQDLSHTTITSPMNGKIVQVNAHEGEVVITGTMNNPGSVIAVLADLSEVLVQADVTETDVVKVQIGQRGKLKIDAVPDKEYTGRVVEIGSSAVSRATSPGVRFFEVKIAIENPDDRLRPGMTSQVDIVAGEKKGVLSVPVQSVVERNPLTVTKKKAAEDEDESAPKKKYVLKVDSDRVHYVEVRTGIADVTHVEITSGVKEGEKVVTGPFRLLKKLREGDSVQPEKEESSDKSAAAEAK
jgi:HlyD family secretion protein